jgi:hypothetical protein
MLLRRCFLPPLSTRPVFVSVNREAPFPGPLEGGAYRDRTGDLRLAKPRGSLNGRNRARTGSDGNPRGYGDCGERGAADGELRSWRNSLPALASLLSDAGLGGVEILIEYRLPLSSKRVDALLVGTDHEGDISVLVCELKQWTSAEIESSDGRVVSVAGRLLSHPQQQVAGYVEYLADFIPLFESAGARISGFVFLHNADSGLLDRLRVPALTDLQRYPMFGGDQIGELRELLADRLRADGASLAADRLLQASPRPSKTLLAHVDEQIRGEESFNLLDEQRLAFDLVRSRVEEAKRSDKKTALIVLGGPGTGKSVIATQLVG